MEEPRLFETHGAVEAMTLSIFRAHDGWMVVINSRREGDARTWDREAYQSLSWGELVDVLTATALS